MRSTTSDIAKIMNKHPAIWKGIITSIIDNLEDQVVKEHQLLDDAYALEEACLHHFVESIAKRIGELVFVFYQLMIRCIKEMQKGNEITSLNKEIHRHVTNLSRYLEQINPQIQSSFVRDSLFRQIDFIHHAVVHRMKKEYQKEIDVMSALQTDMENLVAYIKERR